MATREQAYCPTIYSVSALQMIRVSESTAIDSQMVCRLTITHKHIQIRQITAFCPVCIHLQHFQTFTLPFSIFCLLNHSRVSSNVRAMLISFVKQPRSSVEGYEVPNLSPSKSEFVSKRDNIRIYRVKVRHQGW